MNHIEFGKQFDGWLDRTGSSTDRQFFVNGRWELTGEGQFASGNFFGMTPHRIHGVPFVSFETMESFCRSLAVFVGGEMQLRALNAEQQQWFNSRKFDRSPECAQMRESISRKIGEALGEK